MTKKFGFWLILGAILVISGILGFTVLMGSLGWDFAKLGNSDYETNTHEVDADFINIRIDVDTANVAFLPSEDGKCKVVCHEDPDERHLVFVDGDTLSIASLKYKTVLLRLMWLTIKNGMTISGLISTHRRLRFIFQRANTLPSRLKPIRDTLIYLLTFYLKKINRYCYLFLFHSV